jgi:oligopeptide transport system ATP-binding protein
MYASKVVEYGDVNEIFYNPKHPYTLGLLSSIPKLNKNKDTACNNRWICSSFNILS